MPPLRAGGASGVTRQSFHRADCAHHDRKLLNGEGKVATRRGQWAATTTKRSAGEGGFQGDGTVHNLGSAQGEEAEEATDPEEGP